MVKITSVETLGDFLREAKLTEEEVGQVLNGATFDETGKFRGLDAPIIFGKWPLPEIERLMNALNLKLVIGPHTASQVYYGFSPIYNPGGFQCQRSSPNAICVG